MQSNFEFLEHTADLKFRAYGGTLEEALVNCARAFKEATAGGSVIEPLVEREVKITASNLEELVHDWISELIFLFSTEELLFIEFEINVKGKYELTSKIRGEKFNPRKHKLFKEVKAATYHDMKIHGKDGGWIIEVVCDT